MLATVALLAAPPVQAAAKVFQFTAVTGAGGNTSGAVLTLSNPALDGKPALKLIINQRYGGSGTLNNHPVGVFYDPIQKKWEIMNEDGAAIPNGAIFNVLLPAAATRVNAGTLNSFADRTFFPLEKKNANALLIETHVINPFPTVGGTLTGVKPSRNVGFYFNLLPPAGTKATAEQGSWSIYNEDSTAAFAVAYNVVDVTKHAVSGAPQSFTYTTTASNPGAGEYFTNPLTDGKPGAVLFVSHLHGAPPNNKFFDYAFALNYLGNKWGVIIQDGATDMPANITFIVDVYPAVTP